MEPIIFYGQVVHGNHLGRTIGIPTANIKSIDNNAEFPETGVYASWVIVSDERYPGVTNIGYRPTIQGTEKKVEVHLLDFSGDLYNSVIQIILFKRIRSEKKFPDLETLAAQIRQDILITRKLIS